MRFRAWAPALLWMLAIFVGSTDQLSSRNTSRFLEPILHWLRPSLTAGDIQEIQFLLRKAGHVTEYAVLALLLRRALAGEARPVLRGWEGRTCAAALALSVSFAISDEFHQSFVPARDASVMDVGIDAVGAALGLLTVWVAGRVPWRRLQG